MNIGIFGVGSFGEKHIKVIQNINKFNIIGFHDPDKKKSKDISKKYKLKYFESPINLINKCDAIDIVSNTSTHYNILEQCINLNKNIFIEKPICSSKSELNKIITKTINYKPIIQVGHIERYNPAIQDGFYNSNNIHSINTYRTGTLNDRNKNTSITLDLMIHDIDLILSNVQSEITNLNAIGKNKSKNLYNHVECNMQFANGMTAQLIAIRNRKIQNERKINIHLLKKIIEIDLLNQKQTHIINNDFKIYNYKKNTNLLEKEFMEFYNCITNQKKPQVSTQEACEAVNIALKIDEIIN